MTEQRVERLLERDPEDVPAVQWRPRPRRPLATLPAVAGRAHDQPRFLPDGERILVTRFEPRGDGTLRPDLFLWHWRTGRLQRVTRGAAIRSADPLPDGSAAIGVRCLGGSCDLVRVALDDGSVSVLQAGSPTRTWHRPRVSPDGAHAIAALQEHGLWRLVRVELATGEAQSVGPADGASRYEAEWLPGGDRVVAVSERGGVADLEVVDLASGLAQPLTRVTGGVQAPAPHPSDSTVFFLNLHTRGLDLHRLHADSLAPGGVVELPSELWPAAPPGPAEGVAFGAAELSASRPYGLGPRSYRIVPGGGDGPDGGYASLVLYSTDPVGRLSWMAQGAHSADAVDWSGGSLRAQWRGTRPSLGADLFATRHRPSLRGGTVHAPPELDAAYDGALAVAAIDRDWASWRHQLRLGASYGQLDVPDAERRQLGFAEYRIFWSGGQPTRRAALWLELDGAVGRTGGTDWQRGVGTATIDLHVGPVRPQLAMTYGAMTEAGSAAAPYERFVLGGRQAPLFDRALLSQRLAMPALPIGFAMGTQAASARIDHPLGPVRPYFWAGSVDDGFDHWFRVAGAEFRQSLELMPIVRLPGAELVVGIGYSLDEPLRRRWSWYSSLVFRP
jgi:hypothetical protein